MKPSLVFASLIFIAFGSLGQCKWKIDRTDPITEEKHLESKRIMVKRLSSSIQLILARKGDVSYLTSDFFVGLIADETIRDPKLQIKLEDGNLITMEPTDVTAKLYSLLMKYVVSESDLLKLANSNVVAIQASFNAIEKLYELKKGEMKAIRQYASCLADEI